MTSVNLGGLVNRLTGGNSGAPGNILWWKSTTVNGGSAASANAAGRWTSLWQFDGNPAAGTAPSSSARVITDSDQGCIRMIDAESPSISQVLAYLGASAQIATTGTLLFYDRIMDVGGLVGNVATQQDIDTGTGNRGLGTRDTRNIDSADDSMMFVEIYTAIGGTGVTATLVYSDSDGNSLTTQFSIGGSGLNEAQRMIMIPRGQSIYGPVSFTNLTLSATTGTAGSFGLVIGRPLFVVPGAIANTPYGVDFICTDPTINLRNVSGGSLAVAFVSNGGSLPQPFGQISTVCLG